VTATKERTVRRWFGALADELGALAHGSKAQQLAGDAVSFVEPPFEIVDVEMWDDDTGWFFEVAKVNQATGSLSVWLDRYLDHDGDAHLSVWYQARQKRVMALADRLRVPIARRYTWKHRSSDGLLQPHIGRAETAQLGTWLVDGWRPSEAYAGKYVVASPHLTNPKDVIGLVGQALRQLAQGVLATEPSPESNADDDGDMPSPPPPDEAMRYRALIERLARPGQARFRATLLAAFGGRCVVTGCSVSIALEAAHIRPVSDSGSDHLENGLLLRADLHRLFDDGLISVSDAADSRVLVAKQLNDGPYGTLSWQPLAGSVTAGQRRSLALRNRLWTDHGITRSRAD
jgi:hypothetical protein